MSICPLAQSLFRSLGFEFFQALLNIPQAFLLLNSALYIPPISVTQSTVQRQNRIFLGGVRTRYRRDLSRFHGSLTTQKPVQRQSFRFGNAYAQLVGDGVPRTPISHRCPGHTHSHAELRIATHPEHNLETVKHISCSFFTQFQ
ncbi:hypothetical protein SAMN05216487_2438 [Pseudomonas sp. UC 17F4]|nr:hypothetical protein SAMN05216487_2438 [Pseudomonas sp. UC 17F4]